MPIRSSEISSKLPPSINTKAKASYYTERPLNIARYVILVSSLDGSLI